MQIGALYISAFPAWVVAHTAPPSTIQHSPIAVISAGHVIAANKAAQRSGIEVGITAARAERLCPEASICLRDAFLEEAAWEDVLQSVNRVTPFLESAPPLVYFKPDDIPTMRRVTQRLGAQSGIAPDRHTACLAALRAAQGNTLVIEPCIVADFLNRYPVDQLVGLNFEPDLIEQLGLFGLPTLGAVRTLSRRHIVAQFGEEGKRLYDLLHASDVSPIGLYKPPRAIRRRFDFDDPRKEPGEILPVVEHLIRQAVRPLHSERCQRIRVGVWELGATGFRFTGRILQEPVSRVRTLMNIATMLVEQQLLHPGCEIDALAVELGALRHATPQQRSLFRRRPSLSRAVKAVHRRFPGMIRQAVLQHDTLFSEEEMRFEPFPEKGGIRSAIHETH